PCAACWGAGAGVDVGVCGAGAGSFDVASTVTAANGGPSDASWACSPLGIGIAAPVPAATSTASGHPAHDGVMVIVSVPGLNAYAIVDRPGALGPALALGRSASVGASVKKCALPSAPVMRCTCTG